MSSLSFISSNGLTSLTIVTPDLSQEGRPAGNTSSTTHCRNGSVITGHASSTPSFSEMRGAVGIRRRRHDAVDHGGRAGDLLGDMAGEAGVAKRRERDQQAMQRRAVGGQVVATDDGERLAFRRRGGEPAPRRGSHARSVGCPGAARSAAIAGFAASRSPAASLRYAFSVIVSVTMRMRGSQSASSSAAGSSRRHQHGTDRADDAQPLAVVAANGQRIEPVLRRQRVMGSGTLQRCADDAPAGFPGRQALVDIGGLVGAMECADAEVDDARRRCSTCHRPAARHRPEAWRGCGPRDVLA